LVLAAIPGFVAGCSDDTTETDDGDGGSAATGGTGGTGASGGMAGAGGSAGEGGSGGSGGSGGEGGSPSPCGNMTIDTGEDCDGAQLGGEDCVSQGFVSGTLDCDSSCNFDTSGCVGPMCGDMIVNGTEDCEPGMLGVNDCVSEGYDGGTLDCDAGTCAFDVTGCYVCGDMVIGGPEVCDGVDVGAETCATQGYPAGGTLGCALACDAFDTSACMGEQCGNGVDDDADTDIDCLDTDCIGSPACTPVEIIVDCAPAFCTLTAGAGPNGGDLCSCTIPPGRHPVADDAADAGCFLSTAGTDLLLQFTTAPLGFSASTCNATEADSSVAAYDSDPTLGGVELGCNDDASPIAAPYCSELGDNPAGAAFPVSSQGSTQLWFQVDEYVLGDYWDNISPRTIDIELIAMAPAEICSDGIDNDLDGNSDCADTVDCAAAANCIEAGNCNDGIDNDLDGDSDCADTVDCAAAANCIEAGNCNDLIDNDLDGDTDCADTADCGGDPACVGGVEVLAGCDPTYCTFSFGTGAHGGDVCSCTIPAAAHPNFDDLGDASCFGSTPGIELLWFATGLPSFGYAGYTVTSCTANQEDSSIAAYDGDPALGGVEVACDEDAAGETAYCSEIVDSGGAGPGNPTALPLSGDLYLVIDEWNPGSYWDGVSPRTFEIELLQPAVEAGSCGDAVDNDFDGDTDCADVECALDPLCAGPVEYFDGCDLAYCTFTPAGGPNGGDLCSCVFPASLHPVGNDLGDASCFGGTSGREMLWSLSLLGYTNYTVTTCNAGTADSSIGAYDGDPTLGGVQVACDEDAAGEPNFCSEITDSGSGAAQGLPTPVPVSGEVWLVIDEWNVGSYWNGTSARTIDFEAIP
jgi:hypothetical protein